jgi:hypothetical protein
MAKATVKKKAGKKGPKADTDNPIHGKHKNPLVPDKKGGKKKPKTS